jgi:hypothetical protein
VKVETLAQVDSSKARELWQKYQTHKHYQTPVDAEVAAIYKHIAQGKTVIRALESIRAAGLGEDGCPRLAIARADMSEAFWTPQTNDCTFGERWPRSRSRKTVTMDWAGLSDLRRGFKDRYTYNATVPLIPVHLRPKRGLANYHILWEAEWTKRYPVDPYLLRRVGGDAWLVVAAWDLTDVERAVMSQRVRS